MGRGRESEGSTAETVRKRPERPWTAARTTEMLRRCPLAIAQRLVHCAIAVSTAVLDRVTKTMSVALLLTNNLDKSKRKMSNLLSPAPPPYSWSLLGKIEGPTPPPSFIFWDLLIFWSRLESLFQTSSHLSLYILPTLWSLWDGGWPQNSKYWFTTSFLLSLTLEEGAGKRCWQCADDPNSKHWFTTSFLQRHCRI